jgi:hypothetical protein
MSNQNAEPSTMNTDSTVPGRSSHWKRWRFKTSIALMLLGAAAIITYLVLTGLAKQYAGLGAALCAVACGGFLVWHTVHLFAEEDAIDEKLLNQNAPTPRESTTDV